MMKSEGGISTTTLETLARTFFKEASSYGFQQVDYVRFVNLLLDRSMDAIQSDDAQTEAIIQGGRRPKIKTTARRKKLPIRGMRIKIRKIDQESDEKRMQAWLKDE